MSLHGTYHNEEGANMHHCIRQDLSWPRWCFRGSMQPAGAHQSGCSRRQLQAAASSCQHLGSSPAFLPGCLVQDDHQRSCWGGHQPQLSPEVYYQHKTPISIDFPASWIGSDGMVRACFAPREPVVVFVTGQSLILPWFKLNTVVK